ncbi:OmpH family outer membrane protein [Weeksellaceae bacterium KMM 9724]|uniref:OmpH family outer membrane protein n=1 Tax=Profundicola chukchiensis TaxID=2961959 RepID=UPI0024380028|nr:OmpH family outer membrane protein [Profundicola chukchiensis]MDG4949430.1 OmpH family outer membrane protein [Profundicola chukchiensis]
MKNLTLIAFFSFLLLGIGSVNAQSVAHVNSNTILEALPDYIAAQTKLETEAERHQAEVERREAEMQTIWTDGQKQMEAIQDKSEAEQRALIQKLAPVQEDLQKKQQELIEYRKTAADTLNKLERDLIQPIREKVLGAIQQVGDEKQLAYIIDMATAGPSGTVLYSKGGVDITNDVKKQLGAQ